MEEKIETFLFLSVSVELLLTGCHANLQIVTTTRDAKKGRKGDKVENQFSRSFKSGLNC